VTVVGSFDVVLRRETVWPVDWAVGLDVPEYQDPDVARAGGSPDIPVPPGALVFFSFLPDDHWMDLAGVRFDRSLAARRRVRMHRPLFVGDRVTGEAVISETTDKTSRDGTTSRWVTIATTYRRDGEACVEEHVTYVTRGAA
jgi:hypothetical protein